MHVPPPPAPPLSRCRPLLPAARPTHPAERCHEVSFSYASYKQIQGNEALAAEQGRQICGSEWTYVRTVQDTPDAGDLTWRTYCRRCQLPKNAILMWQAGRARGAGAAVGSVGLRPQGRVCTGGCQRWMSRAHMLLRAAGLGKPPCAMAGTAGRCMCAGPHGLHACWSSVQPSLCLAPPCVAAAHQAGGRRLGA